MSADRVLLVAREGWVLRLLEEGLREAGVVVSSATTSAGAVARIQELEPDCVIVDTDLGNGDLGDGAGDHDGYWVVVRVRKLGGPVAITPIALLAADDDAEARTRAFEAGADVLLLRPFRLEEVLAQVHALVEFARRMRARRTSLIGSLHANSAGPPSSPEAAAFRAELAQMPVSGLLTLLELERKSGLVSVRSEGRRVTLDVASGLVSGATIDSVGVPVIEALALAVAWRSGTITFRTGFSVDPPNDARAIRVLLGELRARDEAPVTPLAVEFADLNDLGPISAPAASAPAAPRPAPLPVAPPKPAVEVASDPVDEIHDIGQLLGLDDMLDPPRLPAPPPTPSILPPRKPMRSEEPVKKPAMTTAVSPTQPAPPLAAKAKPNPKPALAGHDTRQVEVPAVRRSSPAPSVEAETSPRSEDDADSARSTLRP